MPFNLPTPSSLQPDSNCASCVLGHIGQGFISPEGSGSSGVAIFGEASGETEAKDSLPFRPYAPAGSVLNRAIARASSQQMPLTRESFVLANSIFCRPPGNDLEGMHYEQEAISNCRPNIDAVIKRYKPKCILALGNVAARIFTGLSGEKLSSTSIRGYVLHSPMYDIPVVVSHHPMFIRHTKMKRLDVLVNDILLAVRVAQGKAMTEPEIKYDYNPSEGRIRDYLARVEALDIHDLMAYDIETPMSKKSEDEDDIDVTDTLITQIQFAIRPKEALVLDWSPDALEITRRLMAAKCSKVGHNNWRFDDPVLAAGGVDKINGITHDNMVIFHHLQPDLPRGLQYATSFFAPEIGIWKHLSQSDPVTYGGKDVDSLMRMTPRLLESLKVRGIERGYMQKLGLRPLLYNMGRRGIPVDKLAQEFLRKEFEIEQAKINVEILAEIASDPKLKALEKFDPTNGFAGWPKEAQEKLNGLKDKKALWRDVYQQFQISYEAGGELQHSIVNEISAATGMVYRAFGSTLRWARPLEFNPNSRPQMLSYAKIKGYKITVKDRPNGKESEVANKTVFEEWAEDYGDPVSKKVIAYKERDKAMSTYMSKGYVPDINGRVYSTFGHWTGSGQMNSVDVNVQNYPKRGELAKRLRSLIRAREGRKIVELDMKAFHAKTTGWESKDHDYMRLSSLDVHSYGAARLLQELVKNGRATPEVIADVEGAENWITLPDDELEKKLAYIKSKYKTEREVAKACGHGINFHMGTEKLYDMNKESFKSPDAEIEAWISRNQGHRAYDRNTKKSRPLREYDKNQQQAIAAKFLGMIKSKAVHNLYKKLFPKVFKWQDKIIGLDNNGPQQKYSLVSRHGYHRIFLELKKYDFKRAQRGDSPWVAGDSAEDACAFLPSNDAHGELKDRLLEIYERKLDERYGLVNVIHDSVMFECPVGLVGECVETIKPILERPSTVLVDDEMGAFWCGADVSVGDSWDKMIEYQANTSMEAK